MISQGKRTVYPLIALLSGIFIIIFGLIRAKTFECSYFLIFIFLWMALFGCYRACLRVLPMFIVVGGLFFTLFYLTTGRVSSAVYMVNRIGAVTLAIIPGMTTETVAMTRSLSQIHTPRSITLGMLIAMSFMPMLKGEVHRVREAMKTRGAGSIWNPKIFYRALLIPLVMRLVNISDTLALSVETRGFTLEKVPYSIYKKDKVNAKDLIYILGIVCGAVMAVIL